MKEIALGFLSKTLNLDEGSLSEMLYKKADDQKTLTDQLNEDALAKLLALDADRVAKLREGGADTKKIAEDQYKRGFKEAREELEKAIRSEFKTESNAQGLDLIKSLVSAAQAKKLGDDEVKVHPLFLTLEEQSKKQIEAAKAEYEKQFNDLKTSYERKDRFGKVSSEIQKTLEALRPVLPSNPAAAATVRQEFIDRFSAFDYDFLPDGKPLVLRDGKRLEDAHGHPVSLAELVKREAEARFDFLQQDPKGNAGNGAAPSQSGSSVSAPKSEEEFQRAYFAASTAEERQALQAAYSGGSK